MALLSKVGRVLGLGLAGTLLATSVANAGTIVPGLSINGVQLLMTKAAVRARLGAPPLTHRVRSDYVRWIYPKHNDLNVFLLRGQVVRVFETALPGQRVRDHTSSGIGLLSRMSAVKAAYPGHCDKPASHAPPVCTWESADVFMIWKSSGRFGLGWKVPVESIEMQIVGIPPAA